MANSKKRCTYCKKYYPADSMISVYVGNFCTRDHLYQYGIKHTDKVIEKANKLDRQQKAAEKRNLNASDRKKRLPAAQSAFNAYIRKRDSGKPCISCYRSIMEIEKNDGWKVGGSWDCGHFLTIGSHPELRFNEMNAHRQCKSCNGGSGNFSKKNHTVQKEYKIKLVERIGLKEVAWLEGPHEAKKYTVQDLKEIELYFKKKLKLLNA
ncbi:MAG: NinG family protein [Gammaproteobacteria bacterium]|nr:NinG family protein [Gammaproteobacteria bacterium]